MTKTNQHNWSGWPGAFCLKCGADCLIEIAIAQGDFDPYNDVWLCDEETQKEYHQEPCTVSDEEYENRLAVTLDKS